MRGAAWLETMVAFGRLRSWVLALAVLAAAPTVAAAAVAAPVVKTEHLEVQLAPETDAAIPGSTLYVAVRHKIVPGWHTYWRNSGDAGQATKVDWTLPAGWKAGEIVWPKPKRFVVGGLMNYVLEGDVLLPVPIEVPPSAKPGEAVRIAAEAHFLVCADLCVPEDASLTLSLPVAAAAKPEPAFGAKIAEALAKAPKDAGLTAAFERGEGVVRVAVTGDAVKGADVSHAYFFPFEGGVIDHAKPQSGMRGPDGLTLALPLAPDAKTPQALGGVLSLGDDAYVVEASAGPLPAGAGGLSALVETHPDEAAGQEQRGATGAADMGLLTAVAFAFLGGLILNLMPCVFPVLSMKAAALARHAEHPQTARVQGLAFLAGVLVTFLGLAGLLIAARAGGEAVGWGFHLQSPAVVGTLALLMLLVGLNLSGVFEVGLSAQGIGAAGPAEGALGAFFTGALAVVVAAPCTAPFMAGAIGWAFTQPAATTLLVFAALGLGLAAPFVLISFVPVLFKRLPRPGGWMAVLRKVLAFPMYGAAAWLAWVFALQAGDMALPFLFGAAIALAFAAWAWGHAQTTGRSAVARVVAGLAVLAAAPLLVVGARTTAPPAGSAAAAAAPSEALPAEPWSPERVAALRAEGRPVFVDFTAAWCVTCQVNKRTALAGPKVAAAFKANDAVYLEADWTNRDARIAQALAEHGRSGVPLYLVYGGSGEPQVLPQLLTEGVVVKALEKALEKARGSQGASIG